MHCVDLMLNPRPKPGDWDSLKDKYFICHRCEKIYEGESSEVYYFPQVDYVFHLHENIQKGDVYYRAFWIENNNLIHIASEDPKTNFITCNAITLDGKGDFSSAGNFDDCAANCKKFYQSMRRQNRKFVQDSITFRSV